MPALPFMASSRSLDGKLPAIAWCSALSGRSLKMEPLGASALVVRRARSSSSVAGTTVSGSGGDPFVVMRLDLLSGRIAVAVRLELALELGGEATGFHC